LIDNVSLQNEKLDEIGNVAGNYSALSQDIAEFIANLKTILNAVSNNIE
jgi:hypothetical protein